MYSDLTPIFPVESSSRPIALITGASRGIGKAIAETFAQAGYDLILTCRQNREKLETLCKSLSEAYSIQAAAFIGDLGDYETVRELFAPIRRLNLLVNNAGISHIGLLTDMSLTNGTELCQPIWTPAFIPVSSPFHSCCTATPGGF